MIAGATSRRGRRCCFRRAVGDGRAKRCVLLYPDSRDVEPRPVQSRSLAAVSFLGLDGVKVIPPEPGPHRCCRNVSRCDRVDELVNAGVVTERGRSWPV